MCLLPHYYYKHQFCSKILPRNTKPKQKKRPLGTNIHVDSYKPAKRSLSHNRNDYNTRDERVWPFKFYSVDEQWQRNACMYHS